MEIIPILMDYGIPCVWAILSIVGTQFFKPYVKKHFVPYLPLIFAFVLSFCGLFLDPVVMTLSLREVISKALSQWLLSYGISIGLYDLVVKHMRKVEQEQEEACETRKRNGG